MTKQLFTLTEAHIKLLRRLNTDWYEDTPSIDAKRPYGNSDVYRDICETIGEDYRKLDEDDSGYSPELRKTVKTLHEEVEIALQIILACGKIKPGDYVAEEYTQEWEKAK